MSYDNHTAASCGIPYSRKIWRGIKFGALADRPTDRQIKIRQYLIRVYTYVRKINNGCGRSRASARARAHCRSQLFFDVHARRCKILLLLTMSLYRFFTKAGMPSRVPSLADKEIENANTSMYVWIERARVGVAIIIATSRQSSAKFKSANIFVHTGWGQSAKFNARQIFRLYGS